MGGYGGGGDFLLLFGTFYSFTMGTLWHYQFRASLRTQTSVLYFTLELNSIKTIRVKSSSMIHPGHCKYVLNIV